RLKIGNGPPLPLAPLEPLEPFEPSLPPGVLSVTSMILGPPSSTPAPVSPIFTSKPTTLDGPSTCAPMDRSPAPALAVTRPSLPPRPLLTVPDVPALPDPAVMSAPLSPSPTRPNTLEPPDPPPRTPPSRPWAEAAAGISTAETRTAAIIRLYNMIISSKGDGV